MTWKCSCASGWNWCLGVFGGFMSGVLWTGTEQRGLVIVFLLVWEGLAGVGGQALIVFLIAMDFFLSVDSAMPIFLAPISLFLSSMLLRSGMVSRYMNSIQWKTKARSETGPSQNQVDSVKLLSTGYHKRCSLVLFSLSLPSQCPRFPPSVPSSLPPPLRQDIHHAKKRAA